MNKHNRQEIEPLVAASAIVAEALLSEVYGPPPAKMQVTAETIRGKPSAMSIDRDGDGKPDSTFDADFTWLGNLSSMKSHKTGGAGGTTIDFKAHRDIFGHVNSIDIDLNGDGKPDARMEIGRSPFSNVNTIRLDRNNDGKFDSTLHIRRGWFLGKMKAIDVDIDNDGKIDYQVKAQRSFLTGLMTGLIK